MYAFWYNWHRVAFVGVCVACVSRELTHVSEGSCLICTLRSRRGVWGHCQQSGACRQKETEGPIFQTKGYTRAPTPQRRAQKVQADDDEMHRIRTSAFFFVSRKSSDVDRFRNPIGRNRSEKPRSADVGATTVRKPSKTADLRSSRPRSTAE